MTTPVLHGAGPSRSGAGAAPLVEARGVTKRFGATLALDDVSFALHAGESHALVGRNGAGKSTLVSLLTGMVGPDTGDVRFGGEPAPPLGARERWSERVACVYQRSTLVPTLSVAENIHLNAQPRGRGGAVDWRRMRADAAATLAEWGLRLDPDASAATLDVVQGKLVEIARALRGGSRFIVLDEPTAHLQAAEIAALFERLQALRADGVTFLYISHHLEEIYEICQRVTVLRDGREVVTAPVAELGRDALVTAMVGARDGDAAGARGRRERTAAAASAAARDVVLELRGLTSAPWFHDVGFTLRAGERLGLAGNLASGSTQVARAVAGLLPWSGELEVGGAACKPLRPDLTIDQGLGFVPPDRRAEGYAPNLSVGDNVTLPALRELGRGGWVGAGAVAVEARGWIERLGIKTSSAGASILALSGGNQQKCVIARALARGPRALVLVQPTAGVDIASKEAIYDLLGGLDQLGVLVVSDELDDLRLCDRVLVMRGGRIAHQFAGGEWTSESLVAAIEGVIDVPA